jgi:hypothetical protein
MTTEAIKKEIEFFVSELNRKYSCEYSTFGVEWGSKFAKITSIRDSVSCKQTSIWGFVSLKNGVFKEETIKIGDLLKAATWKAPAKYSRGNILTGSAIYGKFGVAYMDEVKEKTSIRRKLELI